LWNEPASNFLLFDDTVLAGMREIHQRIHALADHFDVLVVKLVATTASATAISTNTSTYCRHYHPHYYWHCHCLALLALLVLLVLLALLVGIISCIMNPWSSPLHTTHRRKDLTS
jgi:hypothetical protein